MTAGNAITIDGTRFRDRAGRQVILRGVNLGGDCKVPFTPKGHSYLPTDFSDHRNVCFIGRPAPLAEIDSHLARIARWGFNCLRLLTTWEAVAHAGPGEYDKAYLDYFAEVCRRAGNYGLYVFIDFHQDVWSRMSGGDGAPGWTFEAAGLDFSRFPAADAAHVMQARYDYRLGGRQANYPVISWGGNYRMPANGIMWTLFFAGADFAPGATVEGQNIQYWLQDQYLAAMGAVAERVADIDAVIGFDTLNEPGTGYIGHALTAPLTRLFGEAWSPLDGLAVASGLPRDVPILNFGGTSAGTRQMNQSGIPIWLPGHEDPFWANGAWDIDATGHACSLREDYFQAVSGRRVSMERDYMVPFFNLVAAEVRSVKPDWLIFAEVDPFSAMKGNGFPQGVPERSVNASHWYDLATLVSKQFDVSASIDILTGKHWQGPDGIEVGYTEQLGRLKAIGDALNGGAPTLIGETGIPFDMNDAGSYDRWAAGDRGPDVWKAQSTSLDLLYNALDHLLLSSTQWNYTVSNRNDPMVGDGWNQEDLSIWSVDQTTDADDPDSGGRAIEGFCRPFAQAVQGSIVSQLFDRSRRRFELIFEADTGTAATLIYVPQRQFPRGFDTRIDGDAPGFFLMGQQLQIGPAKGRIVVTIQGLLDAAHEH